MAEGGVRRIRVGVALVCVAVLAVACGNYRPNHIIFTFTPVPATVTVNVGPSGTPVAFFLTGLVDPQGGCVPVSADEVTATLDTREQAGFERWLDDIGFTVRRRHPPQPQPPGATFANTTSYNIGVPMGSVVDARTLIKKRKGVLGAGLIMHRNDLGLTGSMLATREAFFGCAAPR